MLVGRIEPGLGTADRERVETDANHASRHRSREGAVWRRHDMRDPHAPASCECLRACERLSDESEALVLRQWLGQLATRVVVAVDERRQR